MIPQDAYRDLMSDIELSDKDDFKPEDMPIKKRLFYGAMIRTFGNIAQSCTIANIKRTTYRAWLAKDEDFRKLMQDGDFEERLLDFAESKLVEKIAGGDIIGILFYLKTKGKKRGYIEGNQAAPAVDPNKIPTWFDAPPKLVGADKHRNIEEAEIIKEPTENDKQNPS